MKVLESCEYYENYLQQKYQERSIDYQTFSINLVEDLLVKFPEQEQALLRIQGHYYSSHKKFPPQ